MNLFLWAVIVGVGITLAIWGLRRLHKPKRAYTVKWLRRAPPPARVHNPIPPGHYRVRDHLTGKTRDVRISHRKR